MKKVFIIGCPRSGTTLLQLALNRHSGIIIPPETKFFFSYTGRSGRGQRQHLRRICNDLGIDVRQPLSPVRTVVGGRQMFEEIAEQYVKRMKKEAAVYFGEKTPEHTGRLAQIMEFFPDAKVLFLYRDGRDVALSLSRMPWMVNDVLFCFCIWLYYYEKLVTARVGGLGNIRLVRYEDLVCRPEMEFRAILDFLGMPFESSVVCGYGNGEAVPAREMGWKARALKCIDDDRVARWREELSRTDYTAMERLGGKALRNLGYDLMTRGDGRIPPLSAARAAVSAVRFLRKVPREPLWNEIKGAIRQWLTTNMWGEQRGHPRLESCDAL